MKNDYVKLTQRLFLLVVSMFLLGLSNVDAQIGNLGIYGSAPTPASTPFLCGTPRWAQLTFYPDLAAGEGIPPWNQVVPLNGLKNFNFFYTADGTGFLSGGGYKVSYLNASQLNCYGTGDIVTYRANYLHTTGVQVRPFNGNLTTPRGIHGIVRAYNQAGAVVALENANVQATYGGLVGRAKTNGTGYFSIYYGFGDSSGFVPNAPHPSLIITGYQDGCSYQMLVPGVDIIWNPDNDPNSPGYYVNATAEFDLVNLPYQLILPCM